MTSLDPGKVKLLLVVARRIVPEAAALADRAAESIRTNAEELLRQ